ncbi:MAG: LuxR C-terminal-related transcriptional regulator, partial [Candidatus Eisenbacteria bacterium]|nr:LuxR C-terminal-related transcriptional regulator [Candidatus Eisenbacteria bacterium]
GFQTIDGEVQRNVVFWEQPTRTPMSVIQRFMDMLEEHPFTQHARATGDWGPLRLSDFMSDAELQGSRLYREVYRHSGVGRLLSTATFRGNRVGTLNLCRPTGAPDFTERDRELLRFVTPHFVQALAAAEMTTAREQSAVLPLATLGLTHREAEVARWIARGRTNTEIAKILEMAPRTVEKHVENILVKLGVENRTAAAMMIGGRVTHVPRTPPPPGTGPRKATTRKKRKVAATRPKSKSTRKRVR